MTHDENDRARDVFREVYQHVETASQEPPTWSSIQKPGTPTVNRRSGVIIALATAAVVVIALGLAGLGQLSSRNEASPVGSGDTDGVIMTMYLADGFGQADLESIADVLDTSPLVIEWLFVDESRTRDEARARYVDEEAFQLALQDHPDLLDPSIRVLVATPEDAIEVENLVLLGDGAPDGPRVLGIDISQGSSATDALEIPVHDDGPAEPAATTIVSDESACPVTIPPQPGFAPPDGYPAMPVSGVWYGTEGLWTAIETAGISSPRKTVLWSVNFPGGSVEEQPEVDVTWTRIDILGEPTSNGGDATNAYTAEDGWFMIAGLDPDEPGCWQVTSTYKGATLTYVYQVPSKPTEPPSADPLFNEESPWILLFDGPDGVVAIDPDNPIGVRSNVYGDRAGDQPYYKTRVGDNLVVGWGIIYATSIISGDSTPLGAATLYVPAAEPDRVWLIDWAGDSGETTAWQVDMEGRVVVERATFPGRAFPGIGIPGGIAIETDTGLEAWYPNAENPESIWGDRQASVLDVNGSVLAFCPTEPCTDPHFIEIGTGRVSKVGLPSEVAGPVRERRSARFSPDGSKMAFATDLGVVLLDLETLLFKTIANDLTSTDPHVYISWSPDGEVLFASAYTAGDTDMTIARYDVASRDLQIAQLPYRGAVDFTVLARAEADLFLDTSS